MIDRNLCKREAARTRYITGEIFENDLTLSQPETRWLGRKTCKFPWIPRFRRGFPLMMNGTREEHTKQEQLYHIHPVPSVSPKINGGNRHESQGRGVYQASTMTELDQREATRRDKEDETKSGRLKRRGRPEVQPAAGQRKWRRVSEFSDFGPSH